MNICITVIRLKYECGWYFSEASIASCGFTYNGTNNNQHQFERIRSIDASLELDYNIQNKTRLWNISV